MEEKSRMAQPPRPESRPPGSGPPRRRKLKIAPASIGEPEPSGPLPDSHFLPDSQLQLLPDSQFWLPPKPTALPADPTAIRKLPRPIETPHAIPKPAAGSEPALAATYPGNIDVEALTKNLARLVEEGGRA